MTFLNEESRKVLIENSAGWIVTTGGGSTNIVNSAGWVVAQSNTEGLGVIVRGGTVNIINSAGWVFAQSNTAGQSFSLEGGSINIINSAGWVFAQSNTAGQTFSLQGGTINIINSAGWIVAQSNTAGMSAFAIDSAAVGAVVSVIASTIGTVVLAPAQTKRVSLSIYNASANPLYMKHGSGAKSTDFTLMMVSSGFYEVPRPIYNGQITGVWGTADGSVYVTETT